MNRLVGVGRDGRRGFLLPETASVPQLVGTIMTHGVTVPVPNDETTRLRKQVEALQKENASLREQLTLLDKLNTEKTSRLTTEIGSFQKELTKANTTVRELSYNVRTLTETVRVLHEEKALLEKDNADLRTQIEQLEQERENDRTEMRDLREKVFDLEQTSTKAQARIDRLEEDFKQVKLDTDVLGRPQVELEALIDSEKKLAVGQTAFAFGRLMYWCVLPDEFNEYLSLDMKTLTEDLESLSKEEQKKAKDMFERVKKSIGWQDKYTRTMRQLKKVRIAAAHPGVLTVENFKSAAACVYGKDTRRYQESVEFYLVLQKLKEVADKLAEESGKKLPAEFQ